MRSTTRFTVMAILYVLLLAWTTDSAAQQSEAVLSPSQASTLAGVWIDYLGVLKDYRDLSSDSGSLGEMMTRNRYARNRLRSPLTTSLLNPAGFSENELASTLLRTADTSRQAFLMQNEKGFALLTRLSRVQSESELNSLEADVASLAGDVDELWRDVPMMTILLIGTLRDSQRVVDGKLPFMLLTEKDRGAVRSKLLSTFPKARGSAERHALDVSASLLYEFLGGGLKSADAR